MKASVKLSDSNESPLLDGYCGPPDIPGHVLITHGYVYTYPNTVEFGCEEGYFLQGPRYVAFSLL